MPMEFKYQEDVPELDARYTEVQLGEGVSIIVCTLKVAIHPEIHNSLCACLMVFGQEVLEKLLNEQVAKNFLAGACQQCAKKEGM